MKCRPGKTYGSMACLLGIQKAANRFDTSGPRQPPRDSHRYEAHDGNGAGHMSDILVALCFLTFEMFEIP